MNPKVKSKPRFVVYHAHYTKIIGRANTLEKAFYIGEQFGCRDYDCLCCRYYVYDTKLKTKDINEMLKQRIKEEDYAFYRKTGKWRK